MKNEENMKRCHLILLLAVCVGVLVSCNKKDDNIIDNKDVPINSVIAEVVETEFYKTDYTLVDYNDGGKALSNRDIVFTGEGFYSMDLYLSDKAIECEERYYSEPLLFDNYSMPVDENYNSCVYDKYLCMHDYDGNMRFSICLNDIIGDFYEWPRISVTEDGNAALIVAKTELISFETVYVYLEVDDSGEIKKEVYLGFDQFCYIDGVEVDSEGSIYAYCKDENYMPVIYVFSPDGVMTNKYSDEVYNVTSLVRIDGSIYAIEFMYDQATFETKFMLAEVENLTNTILLDVNEIYEPMPVDDGFIFKQATDKGEEVAYYSLSEDKVYPIIYLNETDLLISNYCFVGNDASLITCGTNGIDSDMYLCKTIPVTEDPNANKEKLVLGGIGISNDSCIQNLVFKYNISHEDSYFDVLDYKETYSDKGLSDEELTEFVLTQLVFDNIDGNMPDVLVCVDEELPFYSLSETDFFLDLNKCLDVTGLGVNTVIGNKTGSLYSMPSCYSVNGVSLDNKYQIVNWDYDDFYQIEKKSLNDNYQAILCGYAADEYLNLIVKSELPLFFDIESKQVNFNSDEFISALEWSLSNGKNEFLNINNGELDNSVASDDIASANLINLNAFMLSDKGSDELLDNQFLGYPTTSGELISASMKYSFAITSGCSDVDAASDLLMLSLETNMQKVYSRLYFPVNSNSYAEYVETISDSYLKSIAVELPNRINGVCQIEPELLRVVYEEAQAYFCGQKSASDVAVIIQDRAERIMSEKYC